MKYKEVKANNLSFKVQEYTDLTDLQVYLDTTPIQDKFFSKYNLNSNSSSSEFAGTSTYTEALKLLSYGWTPKAEKFASKLPVTPLQANNRNTRPAYSVTGHQASVPRYLQGIPTNMVDRKPQIIKQKIITINKCITFNCNWDADKIEQEGIKTLQIIQGLEGQGYRVKLNILHAAKQNNEIAVAIVTVKKPEERMSLSKIAFPIAHPSMLRRVFFRWTEVNHTLTQNFSFGYGSAAGSLLSNIGIKNLILNEIGDIHEYIENYKNQK